MRFINLLLVLILISQISYLPASARPGEVIENVLKRYDLEGQKSAIQGDYLLYKVSAGKFISQPTLFFKVGANGIVLEENFLFDKNTVHEKDVQRSKNDSIPTVSIPHAFYLVGDFSQLPREQFDTKSKAIGAVAAPFGAAVGTIAGAGKGLVEGTKIGVATANSASRALGGDISGRAGAWASSATAVATGAVTGLFAGFTGGAVEGSVRGARVAIEGISGADRQITGVTPVDSNFVVIGGRIGKELTAEEQKSLLDELSKLEQSRLAGLNPEDLNKNLANKPEENPEGMDKLKGLDSAEDKTGFDNDLNYPAEDAANKNVAGMW
ncbi:MAG: hypothetical protein A3I68_00565 [Candidatus Melainabacteria bacterium RIFCSPLOWO2_02_FULL_35_15]|nr:MAG: hypothetical protein A3F80_05045 [Candidatus Melainabacteria bacterium RIFCSPLOWO2_12_FULL_35_11]OGI14343.1 MAG: hypothetical protein A3I68_00565 [Candidatus Melainabacteria bacterium RIFCSPLOWO2_02_FULL_35_15]